MSKAIPVTCRAPKRRADDSVTLTFDTNYEVSEPDMMEMDMLRKKSGWLVFSENQAPEDVETPKEAAPVSDSKSPSKRLRAVLFVLYKQKNVTTGFEQWYADMMEQIISKIKDQLEEG